MDRTSRGSEASAHAAAGGGWVVVVPVKRLAHAKSRIMLPPAARERLVLAMLADTLAAAGTAAGVTARFVVTNDPQAAALATMSGAGVLADPGRGLNAAVRHGLRVAADAAAATAAAADGGATAAAGSVRAAAADPTDMAANPADSTVTAPTDVVGVAALTGDLPALRPEQLTDALAAALPHRWAFVPDRAGTGTVLLARTTGHEADPHFGRGSRSAHRRAGAIELSAARGGPAWAGLRCDVDLLEDLDVAVDLGVGPRTAALLGSAGGGEGLSRAS